VAVSTEPADDDTRNWSERLDGHCLVRFQNRLDHDFAIADHEVTIDQYERFNVNYRLTYETGLDEFLLPGTPGTCPAVYVSMYDAMKYCNWLSSEDGLPKHEWCYEEYQDGTFEPVLDYLEREGYRLPTREEWLVACRGDATTPFSFGSDLDMLGEFAWYYSNSRSHGQNRALPVGKLKPNRFGMFDMYGNVWEWATEFGTKDSSLLCGASCDNDPADLMATDRANPMRPEARQHRIGFRVAQTLKAGALKAQAIRK